ncbi:DOMON-like domain-containing protein [Rhizorhapis sp. SPR117]|uniref:DOMON-like domain-containing protein n=1 Tax=Rhizorhapis sp. SPR117 TaxID=2912611 RepID=UPI001F34B59B|nr:DOMON-like domain-containing protein [Rhizorhapis sp. SPR117]
MCLPVTGCGAKLTLIGPTALALEYVVRGDIGALKIPAATVAAQCDNLWQATCFELFVALDDGGYAEYNFAPSSCWAAYRFDDYRTGIRAAASAAPVVEAMLTKHRLGVSVQLDLGALVPDLNRRIGLSAVIEQQDGSKSWWALQHPSEKPDFHHRDCFALQLGAANGRDGNSL